MKEAFSVRVLTSLQKVFSNRAPREDSCVAESTMLKNECFSFQVAFCSRGAAQCVRIESRAEVPLRLRLVRSVPVQLAAYPDADDNYLSTEPGLYPDVLEELPASLPLAADAWYSLWVDVEGDVQPLPAGKHTFRFAFFGASGQLAACEKTVEVLEAQLPPQALCYTNWFHADCLAEYYDVEPLSPTHWRIMENFLRLAVRRGMNTVLTPVFTPPLDTQVGEKRMVVQLVEVYKTGKGYEFDFAALRQWVRMCQKVGIQHFEISHFFSQWGAHAAPNVMGTEAGEYHSLFGWDTPADGEPYRAFLKAFIPNLLDCLRELGVDKKCFFHISDEPLAEQAQSYAAAAQGVSELLEGYPIMDALSEYTFYESGLVKTPVVSTNHIQTFLDHQVTGLWAYYCCGQNDQVANRFIAMPSARNRVLGVQLYLGDIEGFLQWGYNFYHSAVSRRCIDPYRVTDADGQFPAGDPFVVYPGAKGEPVESLRLVVFAQALQDLRALRLLESLIGRDKTVALVNEGLTAPITFARYPKEDGWLMGLRRRVNEAIMRASNKD